jgi:hypothetical protein
MSKERRELELDVQWHGRKSTVKVDGETFLCDRAVIDSSSQYGVTVVEMRYLHMGGEPFRVQGRLQPTHIGPTSQWSKRPSEDYDPIDIDILIRDRAMTTTCVVNGEPLKEAYRTVVTLDVKQQTHVEIYYTAATDAGPQLWVIEGDMLPPAKDAA